MGGRVGGQASGTGACAVLKGSLGCPGPNRRPGDGSDGRQRCCGWVGRWRPLEREKTTLNCWGLEVSKGRGAGHPTFQGSGSRAHSSGLDPRCVGASMLEPLPGAPEGGLPLVPGGGWLQKAGLVGKGRLLWGRVALCGRPGVHAALAPLGPLCSEGGKATEGFCRLWAGASSGELLSWLRSVAWRGPLGLLRSG